MTLEIISEQYKGVLLIEAYQCIEPCFSPLPLFNKKGSVTTELRYRFESLDFSFLMCKLGILPSSGVGGLNEMNELFWCMPL